MPDLSVKAVEYGTGNPVPNADVTVRHEASGVQIATGQTDANGLAVIPVGYKGRMQVETELGSRKVVEYAAAEGQFGDVFVSDFKQVFRALGNGVFPDELGSYQLYPISGMTVGVSSGAGVYFGRPFIDPGLTTVGVGLTIPAHATAGETRYHSIGIFVYTDGPRRGEIEYRVIGPYTTTLGSYRPKEGVVYNPPGYTDGTSSATGWVIGEVAVTSGMATVLTGNLTKYTDVLLVPDLSVDDLPDDIPLAKLAADVTGPLTTAQATADTALANASTALTNASTALAAANEADDTADAVLVIANAKNRKMSLYDDGAVFLTDPLYLNFTGDGVELTDGGNGFTTITIPGATPYVPEDPISVIWERDGRTGLGLPVSSTTGVQVTGASVNLVIPGDGKIYDIEIEGHAGFLNTTNVWSGIAVKVGTVLSNYVGGAGATFRNEHKKMRVNNVAAGTYVVQLWAKVDGGSMSFDGAWVMATATPR